MMICYMQEIFSLSSFVTDDSFQTKQSSGRILFACCHGYNYIRLQKRSRELFVDSFFYTYFRKQMSRKTSANTSASISTIHIFRHVTDQFCYFPSLLFFFFTQPTFSYNESKRSKKRREKGRDKKKKRDKNNEEEEVRYYWSTLSRRMS